MTALALGIDAGAARGRAVRDVHRPAADRARPPTSGSTLHPRARASLFPALGAYVGGDIVAGMLATGMDRDKRTRLFIDVGTNCEIVLSDGDTILSTAAPAGPAFEGGAIRCGMRAADGAIETMQLETRRTSPSASSATSSRAGCAARGWSTPWPSWCRVGLLDSSGRFVPDHVARRDRAGAGRPADPGRRGAGVRPAPARRPTPTSPRSSTSPSATYASCSSRRPPSPPAGPCCSRSSGCEHRDVQQVLLAGLVRQLPLPRLRRPDRTGAAAAGAADRRCRQRRRRGREDGAAVDPRARRRPGPAGGGDLCRALRPPRLQRQVRRAARLRG